MRRATTLTVFLALIVATAAFAAEIPDRPEKLKFPELTFDVPDADTLRFELADGTPGLRQTGHPVSAGQHHRLLPRWPLPRTRRQGGSRRASPERRGATGGAGERTAQELDEELDFLAANLGTNIGDVSGSVSLNVLSKDLEEAMAIFMDVLTKPRFQQDRFDKAKDNLLQAMKQRNDDTADIEAREWNRLIFGDDYWQNRLATKASVDAITASDSKAFVNSSGAVGQPGGRGSRRFRARRARSTAQQDHRFPRAVGRAAARHPAARSHAGPRGLRRQQGRRQPGPGEHRPPGIPAGTPGPVPADGRQRHPRRRRFHRPHDEAHPLG